MRLDAGAIPIPHNDEAWRACARIATTHYENFTVGSRLLPANVRKPMWVIYAYCRTVDDLGDEALGDRKELLDAWEEELHACYNGTPKSPIMQALQDVIIHFQLPIDPFLDLITANRIDQRQHRYATYKELLEYCRYSANPVGRLVLMLLKRDSPKARKYSDAVCTALQLTNFWQDVAIDLEKGRIYLPLEDMQRFGYKEEELASCTYNQAFRDLMAFQAARAEKLFQQGEGLIPMLPRRFRIDIALFSMGGRAILRSLERVGYDVFNRRPTLSKTKKTLLLFQALFLHGPWRRYAP